MPEIKNISCVKCKYHAVIDQHICTRSKCKLTGEDVYGSDGSIIRYENYIEIKTRKRLARSKRRFIEFEHNRALSKKLKDQKELAQVEKDYGQTFEQIMLLLS